MRGQRVRIFTAQQVWKSDYREWKTAIDQDEKDRLRYEMEEYTDAAALERKLAVAERNIDTLAALVRLKYGNLYPEVNQILEDVGHGWPK